MMLKFGLPLTAPITQSVLPVMNKSGIVYGWYPISSSDDGDPPVITGSITFDGTETTYTTTDGVVVPLTTVTVDTKSGVPQYMAAAFPIGIAHNYQPWASADFLDPTEGMFRWWSMPTETWMLHQGNGALVDALLFDMDMASAVAPTPPDAPTGSNGALTWQASVAYEMLNGACPFFDFNWVTLFAASTPLNDPLRIQVLTSPAIVGPATVPPMRAVVTGNPVATPNGPLYNNMRVMKMAESVAAGSYVWTFRITDSANQSKDVTFTLTVQ